MTGFIMLIAYGSFIGFALYYDLQSKQRISEQIAQIVKAYGGQNSSVVRYSDGHRSVAFRVYFEDAHGNQFVTLCKVGGSTNPLFWSEHPAYLLNGTAVSRNNAPAPTRTARLASPAQLRVEKEQLLEDLYSPIQVDRRMALEQLQELPQLPTIFWERVKEIAQDDSDALNQETAVALIERH